MTFENFKKLVDEVGHYLFKINLYGFGEPLLFPETLEMIKYASKNNIGIGISSNLNFHDEIFPNVLSNPVLRSHIFLSRSYSRELHQIYG